MRPFMSTLEIFTGSLRKRAISIEFRSNSMNSTSCGDEVSLVRFATGTAFPSVLGLTPFPNKSLMVFLVYMLKQRDIWLQSVPFQRKS